MASNKSKDIKVTAPAKKTSKRAPKKLKVVGRKKRAVKKNQSDVKVAAKKATKKAVKKSVKKASKKTAVKKRVKNSDKFKAFAVIVVSGDGPSSSMEIMSILARDSFEAMHSASVICINRKTPNDVIIGTLDLDEVKKISSFLEKSEFIGVSK